MIKVRDMYDVNYSASSKMLSDYTSLNEEGDFWEEYRTNYARYDKLFARLFSSFFYFLQEEDQTASQVADAFRDDVYNHLLVNDKKYSELYRVQVIPDDVYSLTNNYDMTETMDKDGTDNQDNTYGARSDSSSLTKGSRQDSTTSTGKVAPYDSDVYANNTEDSISFTEGQQLDSTSATKGQQKDDLDRTYSEDYTLRRVGNIGVQTVSDMLAKHIKVWDAWDFYEYIFKEIAKELLLL